MRGLLPLGIVRLSAVALGLQLASAVVLAQSSDPRLAPCTDRARPSQERADACRVLAGDRAADAETRRQAVIGLAEVLTALGDWNGLLEAAAAQLALDPAGRVGHAMRGMAYLRRQQPGDAERARDAYSEALRQFPRAFLFANNRGVARTMLGDTDGALADHSLALALEPGYLPALIGRSGLLNARGDHVGALADADLGLKSAPDAVPLLDERARALNGLSRLPESIIAHDRVIALAPTRAMVHFRRGLARAELGQLDAAIADFTREIAVNPQLPGAYVQRGRLVFDTQKDAVRAIADFDSAIAMAPAFAMGWSQRSRVRLQVGDLPGAEQDARKALALDQKDPVAKITLAALLDSRDETAEALALLDDVVAFLPSVVESRLQQIAILMRLGRHGEALQSVRAGRKLAPGNLDLIDLEAATQLRLARLAEGKADLDLAIAQGYRRASTHANRAVFALAMRNFELAETDVATALGLEARHLEANALSGLLALRAKDRRKAEAAVAIVLATDPDHALALAVKAETLRQGGRQGEAEQALELSRKKDPRSADLVRMILVP
jgi:tetratricopeptide (TPR) repeat protein